MNKTELIAAMAENSGLTKKDCEAALAAFTGAVGQIKILAAENYKGGVRLSIGPRSLYRRGGDCHEGRRQGADGGLWQLRGKGAPCPCGPQPPHRRTHDLPCLQGADLQARQAP